MLLDQRRDQILELVENKGIVSLQELVETVEASESTIRRDLEYLERIGQIRKTRGGAAYVGESLTAFEDRRTRAHEQKVRVAGVVAGMIESGETILLDGGTTTLEVAKQLAGKSLQVVTNSLPIVNVLINQPKIELILIGGFVYPKTGVALGPLAVEALSEIRVRRLVISVEGITEEGLFNSNGLLVETERRMIAAADEVIVATDSGKLGHSALAHLCPLGVAHKLVVDDGISENWKHIIEQVGVQLIVAD